VLLGLVALTFADQRNYVLEFRSWMNKYEKSYSDSEYSVRFQTFKQNIMKIEKFNKMSHSARFAVNKYADLTAAEFKQYMLGTKAVRNPSWPTLPNLSDEQLKAVPTSWDWRTKNVVTDVKNQGMCGSCWSFSTTGNVEGQVALHGGKLVGLSEQQLVDCDHECMTYEGEDSCDAGCEGGLMPNAFKYIISNNGIGTETDYPYAGIDEACVKNYTTVGGIVNWTMIPSNETQMQGYVYSLGPLSIAVDAELWQFYFGGVFDFPWCGQTLDHGVLIVGFGTQKDFMDEDVDYWLIKNSWGADWGEDGYIKVERNENECGVDLFPCSSIYKSS